MRVGVDIGATKIEFVVLDEKNKVVKERARKRAGHARDARKRLQVLAD